MTLITSRWSLFGYDPGTYPASTLSRASCGYCDGYFITPSPPVQKILTRVTSLLYPVMYTHPHRSQLSSLQGHAGRPVTRQPDLALWTEKAKRGASTSGTVYPALRGVRPGKSIEVRDLNGDKKQYHNPRTWLGRDKVLPFGEEPCRHDLEHCPHSGCSANRTLVRARFGVHRSRFNPLPRRKLRISCCSTRWVSCSTWRWSAMTESGTPWENENSSKRPRPSALGDARVTEHGVVYFLYLPVGAGSLEAPVVVQRPCGG